MKIFKDSEKTITFSESIIFVSIFDENDKVSIPPDTISFQPIYQSAYDLFSYEPEEFNTIIAVNLIVGWVGYDTIASHIVFNKEVSPQGWYAELSSGPGLYEENLDGERRSSYSSCNNPMYVDEETLEAIFVVYHN